MIETTLGTLVQAEPALSRLAEARLPARVSYRVARLIRAVGVEVGHFSQEKTKLLKELGQPEGPARPDGTQSFTVAPERAEEWVRRVTELAAVDVRIELTPIALTDLGDHAMSPADLLTLGPLVVEDEEASRPSAARSVP